MSHTEKTFTMNGGGGRKGAGRSDTTAAVDFPPQRSVWLSGHVSGAFSWLAEVTAALTSLQRRVQPPRTRGPRTLSAGILASSGPFERGWRFEKSPVFGLQGLFSAIGEHLNVFIKIFKLAAGGCFKKVFRGLEASVEKARDKKRTDCYSRGSRGMIM